MNRKPELISTEHPEWGTWTVEADQGDWYDVRGRSGNRIVFKSEIGKFWKFVA